MADGRVRDEASLAAFLEGRLHTTGLVDAALAALLPWPWPATIRLSVQIPS